MLILAFGREKQVGKDTFVMFIIENLRQRFKYLNIKKEAFADRLYTFCESLYGWGGFQSRQYYDIHPAEKDQVLSLIGKTPRQLLLNIGEKVREYDPKAFMNPVYQFDKMDKNLPHIKIVPDMRTPPEFEYGLRQPHVYMTRIVRPGIVTKNYGKEDVDQLLIPYDHLWHETVTNDGDLNNFKDKAINFVDRIIVPRIQERIRGEQLAKRK